MFYQMNKDEAYRLATDLLKLMRSGKDPRDQIDFICNSLRIKKRVGAELQQAFESGVHAGCDAVIEGREKLPQGVDFHPLHVAAYHLGRADFENKLEEQRQKHKPKRHAVVYGLILSIVTALIIVMVALWYKY